MNEHQTLAPFDPITQDDTRLQRTLAMKVRYVQMGHGHLKVYTRLVNDVPVMEAFTLASLADCMGMAPGTMEGRYHRGRLFVWKVDIPTGESRPVRGFPLALLEQVIQVLTTRGARVEGGGTNTERLVRPGPGNGARFPLVMEKFAGRNHITIPALADHYGVSPTTIRNKLSRAGLLAKGVNLNSPAQGGRPRRGFPEAMYDQLVDAIENGAQFLNECQSVYDRVMNPAKYPASQSPVGSTLTFRRQEQLAKPVKQPEPVDVSDIVGELNAIMARAKPARLPDGNLDQAPNPDIIQRTHSLQPWVDKLVAAGDAIWDRDAVIDSMAKAGLTDAQIGEVVALADSASSGQERSAGAQA